MAAGRVQGAEEALDAAGGLAGRLAGGADVRRLRQRQVRDVRRAALELVEPGLEGRRLLRHGVVVGAGEGVGELDVAPSEALQRCSPQDQTRVDKLRFFSRFDTYSIAHLSTVYMYTLCPP